MTPSLDQLAAEPRRAVELSPEERSRVQLCCAAILSALATAEPTVNGEVLLEPDEAARRLKVSRSTVYEMMRLGRIRFVEKGLGERGRLVPESAIAEYVTKYSRVGPRRSPSLDAIRAAVRAVK